MSPPLLRTSFLEKTIFFIFLLGEALSKNMAGARLRAKVVDDEIDTFFFLFVDPSCRLKNDLGWRTQGRTLAFFFLLISNSREYSLRYTIWMELYT